MRVIKKIKPMSFVNPINKSFCLEQLCASNYQKLLVLVPDLLALTNTATGCAAHDSPLRIAVLEQSAYTMTVELNHCFRKNLEEICEPALKIRIYRDAKLAEVLSDHARASVADVFKDASNSRDIMNYKWRLNYFLQKWLDHCLKKDYQFNADHYLSSPTPPLRQP